MELVELGPLSPAEQAQLEGDELNPWGTTGAELEWRAKDHHLAVRAPDGRLVAAAGWLLTEVEVGGERVPVVGIGGVIVAASRRGQGHGRRVIDGVIDRAKTQGAEIALLFCQDNRVELYARRGFLRVKEPVQVEQSRGPLQMPMNTMWRPLRDGAELPSGPLRLAGRPF